MVGLRKISFLFAVMVAPALTGCATFSGVKKDISNITAGTLTAAPVADMACGWQNRLATLPDPTRNGSPTLGIVGQVFLYDANGKPADPGGQLTISVVDAVERGQSASPYQSEVWNFDNASLRRLAITDQRFGKSYVVFLPWPQHWKDVTRFKLMARYDQPNGNTIFGQESIVTLDFSSGAGVGPMGVQGGNSFVPNPNEVMSQSRANSTRNRPMPQQQQQQPLYGQVPNMQAIPWNQQQQQPVQQTGYQQQPIQQTGFQQQQFQMPQLVPPSNGGGGGGIAPVDIPLKYPGQ